MAASSRESWIDPTLRTEPEANPVRCICSKPRNDQLTTSSYLAVYRRKEEGKGRLSAPCLLRRGPLLIRSPQESAGGPNRWGRSCSWNDGIWVMPQVLLKQKGGGGGEFPWTTTVPLDNPRRALRPVPMVVFFPDSMLFFSAKHML